MPRERRIECPCALNPSTSDKSRTYEVYFDYLVKAIGEGNLNFTHTDVTTNSVPCLYPVIHKTPASKSAAASYIRFHTVIQRKIKDGNTVSIRAARKLQRQIREFDELTRGFSAFSPHGAVKDKRVVFERVVNGDKVEEKRAFLGEYPRILDKREPVSCHEFKDKYKEVKVDESPKEKVIVYARAWSVREAGKALVFLDLNQEHMTLQCVLKLEELSKKGVTEKALEDFVRWVQRGDVLKVVGRAHRTARGELSILADSLPTMFSPCQHSLPRNLKNDETKSRDRHVAYLVDPNASNQILLRSVILQTLREFLSQQGHVEVQTPILADGAGGAVARPFFTTATEFRDRPIAMRISPELWLKRLILGGIERVYEIGPCFRNEGIDATHNPEFWTCEFYRTYTHIAGLQQLTEDLLRKIAAAVHASHKFKMISPFPAIDFISGIEKASGMELPNLSHPGAREILMQSMQDRHIPFPDNPTLPRLLDKLSSRYLEPQCLDPTWITAHPECLSPLAKSFEQAGTDQRVAARAELFIDGKEVVNCYEEENSPVDQRAKFEQQQIYNQAEDIHEKIDESYLQALEWGLPPTGGWGCGIDRLCMLFGGTSRIADTLTFGTLRNVVALGKVKGAETGTQGSGEQRNQESEDGKSSKDRDGDGGVRIASPATV